ncbi:7879_t:CDS:2 [Funneliformis geosporum]|uniref:7879_t:CDS:1 n=1 Tax=Funneliformis geosporum TaxID=1117311 RepID=A0A9W4WTF1_9GLOM|nr:7879_t:CDS:2 [Funneliformis geosporum]
MHWRKQSKVYSNPPIKKTTVNKQKTLRSSMKSLLSNNKKLRKEFKTLNKWLIEKENKRKLNAIDETRHAVFKKVRISSSVVNIGNVHHERDSGNASVNREFGKGATLFHGEYKIDPSDLLESFKIEARNHNAHVITQPMGRWNDEELQRLSTLALKVIVCLGDNELFDPLIKIKNELNDKLTERLTLTIENKDEDLADLVDFALDNINKIKSSNKENIKQILQLVMNKDHTFFNIWKCLAFRKDKRMIFEKFITMMNIQFDMDLEIK